MAQNCVLLTIFFVSTKIILKSNIVDYQHLKHKLFQVSTITFGLYSYKYWRICE